MRGLHIFLSFLHEVYHSKGGQNQLWALIFVSVNLIYAEMQRLWPRLCQLSVLGYSRVIMVVSVPHVIQSSVQYCSFVSGTGLLSRVIKGGKMELLECLLSLSMLWFLCCSVSAPWGKFKTGQWLSLCLLFCAASYVCLTSFHYFHYKLSLKIWKKTSTNLPRSLK